MASLALAASIVFLGVLIIGPITYILSLFHWIPDLLILIIALLCIAVGIWWLLLPIPFIKYYGLVDIFCGYKAIAITQKK
jgi:hypothetical protein